ncbi:uncharacterized protein N7459_008413 [Penicillium hispanicum]|uniref:uncharacterized protein n=1 Tax=Penicillium hispanicum TaxID=1080232 RepID=UPI0025423B6D|nr:uncharacterized protein N7459_008413 [Penicillium hispanicum]KAJ5573986.1 hypothetical protein N7459_008413 [Penicillium hispanicum]
MSQTRGSATKFPNATGSRSGSGALCSKPQKTTTGTGTGFQRTVTSKTKPTHTISTTKISTTKISTTTITSSPLSATPSSTSQSTEKTSTTISASPTGWANVTCDSKYATDATMDKAKRWAGAYTDDAWHAAVSYWRNKGKPAGLQFSQAISDFFNGPQEILCDDLSSENGCNDIGAHVCTDFGNKAAGYFIIESFIMIASKILAVANAVVAAVASFDQGTFTNTWAPNHSTSKVPEILMALLGTLFVAVAGPMLDEVIVHFGAYTTQEIDTALFQLNRDLQTEAEIAVDDSLTVLKTAGTAGTALAEEEEIGARVQSIANQFANALNTSDTNLFNGSDASIANLYTYIRNGSQLEATQVTSDDTLKNDMLKIMYAYTIPLAWNLTNSGPFILDTETDCKNGKVDVSKNYNETYLGSGTFPSFCYKNRGYFLASAYAEKGQSCDSLSGDCDYQSFYALDGVKDLDGSQWEGITGENIINGSLNSYFANGEKNGGYSPNLSTKKEIQDIMDGTVTAAGVWNLPVCKGLTAQWNWYMFSNGDGYANLKPWYPCGAVS